MKTRGHESGQRLKNGPMKNMKVKEEGLKVNSSTIMNYMNAPLIVIFGGTKETISKFIISRYHNGKFYFDKPMEISGETIY